MSPIAGWLITSGYAEQNLLMASLLLTMVLPMLSVMTLPPDPLILAASSGSDAQWSLVKLRASLSLDEVQEGAMIHPSFEKKFT